MNVNKVKHHKIQNKHFIGFCRLFNNLFGLDYEKILSNMREASLDDNDKNNKIYLYNSNYAEMDTVKLDDMTIPFLEYMQYVRRLKYFKQPKAVDAVCVDNRNEWFLIEFKNCPIYKNNNSNQFNSEVLTSIRQKMLGSLWFLFTMDSFMNNSIFGDDVTEFARKHITYIVVVSREKNQQEYQRIRQSNNNLYTPNYLKQYVGYYFKDIYLFTEHELEKFIINFKY